MLARILAISVLFVAAASAAPPKTFHSIKEMLDAIPEKYKRGTPNQEHLQAAADDYIRGIAELKIQIDKTGTRKIAAKPGRFMGFMVSVEANIKDWEKLAEMNVKSGDTGLLSGKISTIKIWFHIDEARVIEHHFDVFLSEAEFKK